MEAALSGRGKAAPTPASRVTSETGVPILPWGHFYPDFIATGGKFHREKGGVFLQ